MKLFSFLNKKESKDEDSALVSRDKITKEFVTNFDSYTYWSKLLDNPDMVLKNLGKDVETYDKLLADSHLYACVQSRKSGVLSKEWDIDQSYSDKVIVDFIYDIFQKLDVNGIARYILDAPLFGYQPLEIIWGISNNKYVPINIYKRPRQHFKFNIDCELIYIDELGNEHIVPKYKFLCPTYESGRSNPYGTPLLSKCYWPVVTKNDIRKFWSIFTEKFGTPWVGATYESGRYDETKADALVQNLIGMAQETIFAVPNDVELNIVNGASTANVDMYLKYIKEAKEEISEVILGHTSATTSTPGKLGNEGMAIAVVDRIIESDQRLVEDTFNELIKMVVQLNFNSIDYPTFRFFEEDEINITLAQRDKILTEMGVEFTPEYYIRMHNLSEEDFNLKSVNNGATKNKKNGVNEEEEQTGKKSLNPKINIDSLKVFNSDKDDEDSQILTDDFINKLLNPEDTDKLFNKILKPIFDYAGKTELDKMDKDYYKLFKKIKADEFIELMEKAVFVIQIHGSNSVDISSDKEDKLNLYNKSDLSLKDLLFALEKEPEDIVKYFKSKGVAISSDWQQTFGLIRQHVFTVSGAMKMDVLMDFKDMVEKAIKEGLSQSQFKKELRSRFQERGWLAKSENNKLITSWRLDTIYRTNLQSAFMDGRWNNHNLNVELRPYVQCRSTLDPSTTKECKALNNKVFRVDDKYFANNLRPPGHYNCRRTTVSLSESLVKKRGLKIEKGVEFAKHKNKQGFDNKGEAWYPDESKYPKVLWNEFENA